MFSDKCYNIFDYRYDIKHRNTHDVQTQKIFSIQWTPEKQQTCLAITYIYLPISRGRFLITVSGENKTTITSSSMQKFVSWIYNILDKNDFKMFLFFCYRMTQKP